MCDEKAIPLSIRVTDPIGLTVRSFPIKLRTSLYLAISATFTAVSLKRINPALLDSLIDWKNLFIKYVVDLKSSLILAEASIRNKKSPLLLQLGTRIEDQSCMLKRLIECFEVSNLETRQ